MIPIIIRLLLFALLAVLVVYIIRSFSGHAKRGEGQGGQIRVGSPATCSGCRHFRGAEDDGVFCGAGDFETYKTLGDVEKCPDYARPG